MSFKHISVVILNWNGKAFLEQFLPSVVANSGDAKIVVADNGSTDNSIEFVQTNYPDIELIINKENGGFSKGYNYALNFVDNQLYVLLNSDIEVTPNWLSPLSEMMHDENIAGCQPKVLSFHNKTLFEHSGSSGGFIDRNYFPFCRGRFFDHIEEDNGQYNDNLEIFWATGACLMIRSDVFHKIGGFDEDFFAHMEEIDLCWRIKKMNMKFMVCPSSSVYHIGGGTLPYNSPRKVYLNFRNSLIMITKNHEGALCSKLFQRLILDGIAAITFIINGEFKNFISVLSAHMWYYSHIRLTLKKRKAVKAQATKFNSTGFYTGSIIVAYFIKKIKAYSKLDQRLFK
ncbi:MAG: glycosyltransferase family 2 protein [Crocinitomicaceae bacterium]